MTSANLIAESTVDIIAAYSANETALAIPFWLIGLPRQLRQLMAVTRQPPFIEVSHAKQQSLLR